MKENKKKQLKKKKINRDDRTQSSGDSDGNSADEDKIK